MGSSSQSSVVNKPLAAKLPKRDRGSRSKLWRIGGVVFLFLIVILALAAIVFIGLYNPTAQKYVNKNDLQAVFVNVNGTNGGQVYFGHIQEIAPSYTRLTGIFYIQQSASSDKSSNASQSLVLQKLGCQQIHDPEDQMVINNNEILWWENLNPDGQVAKQVATYYKQNPSGDNCSSAAPKSLPTNNSSTSSTTPSSPSKSDTSSNSSNSTNTPSANTPNSGSTGSSNGSTKH